jgi:stage V sporulation protein AD
VGSELLDDLMKQEGKDISPVHNDCGLMIYDREKQDVHAGGSGCGCSAAILCSAILQEMDAGQLHKVLFIGTGALMSPTSSQQGESIPGVAHLVYLKA